MLLNICAVYVPISLKFILVHKKNTPGKTTKISVWICKRSATAAPMFTLIYDLTIQ